MLISHYRASSALILAKSPRNGCDGTRTSGLSPRPLEFQTRYYFMRTLTMLGAACIIAAYGPAPEPGRSNNSAEAAAQHAGQSAGLGRLRLRAPVSKPDAKADQILNQMHEKSKRLSTIQASIVQLKRFQIGPRETYSGVLYFRHEGPNKDKIRITYKSGGEVTNDLLIDGDKITLYQPKIKQAIITSRARQAEQNPEYDFLAAPYGSVSGLKSRYAITYLRDEPVGIFSTSVIQLTPVGKSSFTKVTFWVDQASWLPVQYKVDEQTGDTTTLTLSNVKRNDQVPADAFKIELPKGTNKITR
jgi:outer membrane lipoprotein-sorting protein